LDLSAVSLKDGYCPYPEKPNALWEVVLVTVDKPPRHVEPSCLIALHIVHVRAVAGFRKVHLRHGHSSTSDG
jgi:hypothetical protein